MTIWFLGGGGAGWLAQPHVGASAGSKDVALGDGFRWVCGKGCRYLKKAYMGGELEVPEKEGSGESVSFDKHCEEPPTWYPSEMMFRACSQFCLWVSSWLLLSYFSLLYPFIHQPWPYSIFFCSVLLSCSRGYPTTREGDHISAQIPDIGLPI